ncbi:DgyrCDS12432 [Dimorphilus gyrociliatus]|uniref:Ribosome biogenesis protein BRX1 homolog n=2 Tax=Dimorphilus gyrociliatus TaxID=2664684 RepID=A0A7I8W6F5_9ANNE|nr:DgyrCDS12432 [Dimorphilus gyrociliatus]
MGKKRKIQKEENLKNVKKAKKNVVELPPVRSSEEAPITNNKWSNKERVLVFSSRGIGFRDRHLMKDFKVLMPHSKSETKMDKKDSLTVINEICQMKNCTKCIYFESKRKTDLYLWMSNCPSGPSVRFDVQNIHTLLELKLTGNCLKHSRPLLCFNEAFDEAPHWSLLKELLIQIFSTPRNHPKSQPFVDHVFSFTVADNRIWFRNYQAMEEDGKLAEIGPRMVLNPIKIFRGSFEGEVLWQNPHYVSRINIRRQIKLAKANKYMDQVQQKKARKKRLSGIITYKSDITDQVFATN